MNGRLTIAPGFAAVTANPAVPRRIASAPADIGTTREGTARPGAVRVAPHRTASSVASDRAPSTPAPLRRIAVRGAACIVVLGAVALGGALSRA